MTDIAAVPTVDGTRGSAPGVPAEACSHERGHITDSMFFGNRFATDRSRRIFCDVCRKQRWLDIEAALAEVQGGLGIIPREAAEGIGGAARVENLDLDAVRDEINRSGHSLVGLLRVFAAACPGDSGQYIHYGATTQDIQDTGQVLEMRDALDELDLLVRGILTRLAELADAYAETIAVGRTHARPALPMSFGLKVASWVDEVLRDAVRLRELRRRVLVLEMFGGVGSMAGFGPRALTMLERLADRLGLHVPDMGWHASRDRVAEYVSTLAIVAGTMGRIAEELRVLGRPEFGEISEPWKYGTVGSSTMPHKRNPERCEQVVVMSRLAAAQVGSALTAMVGDHERDSRSLRLEWVCVPDVSHYTLCACQILRETLKGLTVHPERLWHNTRDVADQIASERLMLTLGEHLGKQTAHERVYALSQTSMDTGVGVRDLLKGEQDLVGLLDEATLDEVFDPNGYIGSSAVLSRRAVASARAWLDEAR